MNKIIKYTLVFDSLVTILFVMLKLTNIISWNWWWVLSPLWLPITVATILILLGISFFYISFGKIELDI